MLAGLQNKQTNKHIIVNPWAVRAVTVGKASPFPYSPLHWGRMYAYNVTIHRRLVHHNRTKKPIKKILKLKKVI